MSDEVKTQWPRGVVVGHTNVKHVRPGVVILDAPCVELTPAEARFVATELLLRADCQDRQVLVQYIDGIPRYRKPIQISNPNGSDEIEPMYADDDPPCTPR